MLKVGQVSSLKKSFSEEEVLQFSAFSKDENPIHFDKDYAAKSQFGQRIVQGPMVASLIGGILGSTLPGNGTIYLSQYSKFVKPVYFDELLTAKVEVIHIRDDKPIVKLRTWIEKVDGTIVLEGEAVVKLLKSE